MNWPPSRSGNNPFSGMSREDYERHLDRNVYGDFTLTEAIRPSPSFVPKQGYKETAYNDDNNQRIPVLTISVTRERLFDVFQELVSVLPETVNVHLHNGHDRHHPYDLCTEDADLSVLQSTLWEPDHRDLLLDDGCTGIAIASPLEGPEVQFDEHKLLYVYGEKLGMFRRVLRRNDVSHIPSLRVITQEPHIHSTTDEYRHAFIQLARALHMDHFDDTNDEPEDWEESLF